MGRKQWRYAPHVAFVGIMAAVIALWQFTLWVIERPMDAEHLRVRFATRMLGYYVTAEQQVRFPLERRRNTVRLVTHGVLSGPEGKRLEPTADGTGYTYGLHLRAVRGTKELWSRELWLTSRQSLVEVPGGLMTTEAFTSDGRLALLDGRSLAVALPEVEPNSELRVTALGSGAVLVRALLREQRDQNQIIKVRDRLAETQTLDLTDARFLAPWSMLAESERDAMLRYRWQKLAAVGERDVDYRAFSHYVMVLPESDVDAAVTYPVSSERWLAVVAKGPCRLAVSADAYVGAQPNPLQARLVGEAGVGDWHASVAAHDLPGGFHTLYLRAALPELRWVTLSGCDGPMLRAVYVRGGDAYATGPGMALRLVAGQSAGERVLRIDVRTAQELVGAHVATAEAGRPYGELVVRYVGDDQKILKELRAPISLRDGYFDRLVLGGQRRDLAASQVLTDVFSVRALSPLGARWLEIETTSPAWIRAYRYTGEQTRTDGAFELTNPEVRWKGAPSVTSSWAALVPMSAETMAQQGRLATWLTQQRLEPLGWFDPLLSMESQLAMRMRVPPPLFSLRPRTPTIDHALREPVLEDTGEGSVEVEVTERPREFLFAATDPTTPALWCEVDAVPRALVLEIGGRTFEKRQLQAREAWRLPELDSATYAVAVRGDGPVRCYLNRRTVAPGVQSYRRRTVHLWRPGEVLEVQYPHSATSSLYAVVYEPTQAAGLAEEVTAELVGGDARRRYGALVQMVTKTERSYVLPPAKTTVPSSWVDVAEQPPGFARSLRFGIGDDVGAGPVTVRWRNLGARPRWVRFVATAAPATDDAARLQRLELGTDE